MNHERIAKSRIGKSCEIVLATKCIQPSSIYAPLIFVTIIYLTYISKLYPFFFFQKIQGDANVTPCALLSALTPVYVYMYNADIMFIMHPIFARADVYRVAVQLVSGREPFARA
jgi:hypothetical protein